MHQKWLRLAIFACVWFCPIEPNERGGFACRLESQASPRVAFPGLQGPQREFAVARTITGALLSIGDEICNGVAGAGGARDT